MTTYYVGPGGNDGNAGTSWALRKLTLNGAEDIPVAAGDTVYVGPGTYRETLTVDVSGSAGSPIVYIGDYTGANTDGVGGVVRITGSDDDQTVTRANCILGGSINYRTFRSFLVDLTSGALVQNEGGTNWTTAEFVYNGVAATSALRVISAGQAALLVDRCVFYGGVAKESVTFSHTSTLDDCGHVIQNCLFTGYANAIITGRVGGIAVKNSTFVDALRCVRISAALAAGQTVTVNNCVFSSCQNVFVATTLGEIVEDYNALSADTSTPRTNTNTGANSNTYPPLFDVRWFFEAVNGGDMLTPFDLASYSQLVNVAGTSPTATDLRGTSVIGAQREWGALEYDPDLDIEAGSGGGGAVSISPWRGNIG